MIEEEKEVYAIFGAGGFGREVIAFSNKMLATSSKNYEIIFIDDNVQSNLINGYKVLSRERFIKLKNKIKKYNIAIGNTKIREKIANEFQNENLKPFNIFANENIVLDSNKIGAGAVFAPYTVVTSNTKIGKFFQANLFSYVAHDCIIGDFVTFSPHVQCNGNVVVEDYAFIGSGAIIKQGKENRPIIIGSNSIVGAGAVVTKSVSSNSTVIGNPAVQLTKENLKKFR